MRNKYKNRRLYISKDTFWIHKILRNSDYGDMGKNPKSITSDVSLNLSIGKYKGIFYCTV